MIKDFKKYNKIIFMSLFLTLVALVLFNWTIDAFNVFDFPKIKYYNALKPQAGRNQRLTKILSYKLDKKNYDAVFLGSSRVDKSISENYYTKITGKRAKNFGMNALSHDETKKLADFAITIHPEVKTIYIGLDFFRFLDANNDDKRSVQMSLDKKITISELNPLILSFNTTITSFNTLVFNIHSKQKKHDTIAYFESKLKQYKKNYENAVLVEDELVEIADLKKELEKKGYNVVLYINPTHVLDLALIDELGYMSLFNEWKIKLAKNFEYRDFDFVSDLTSEAVNSKEQRLKYFSESSHATYAAGNLILDNLVLHKNNLGFAVNSSNVRAHVMQNERVLKKWKKQNPLWVGRLKDIINDEK